MKEFIKDFFNKSGSHIFLSTVLSRLLSFAASWVALQFVPNKELGVILFAYNIITFVLPFSGVGLFQSFLRFAPFLKSNEEKEALYSYVQKKGFVINLLIILAGIATVWLTPIAMEGAKFYIIVFLFILIPDLVFRNIKIYFRIKKKNKSFAYLELLYNCILLATVAIFSYYFQETGYAIALILTPTITSLLYINKTSFSITKVSKPSIVTPFFWKYGFFASLTSISSQLLLIIDILLVGIILIQPEQVTNYRYISLIPLSILFLPQVFMNTDFVELTENITNKKKVYAYIKNYMFLFLLVSIGIVFISVLFSNEILSLFDKNFSQYSSSFVILILGIISILIFRGLFGNLLCSIGAININMYIAIIGLVINIIGNYNLIPIYGIKGAAITSTIVMWFTSLSTTLCFFYLYRNFLQKQNTDLATKLS